LARAHPDLREVASQVSDAIWGRAATQVMTRSAFWADLRAEVKKRLPSSRVSILSDAALEQVASAQMRYNKTLLELAEELRLLGIPMVACSNMTSFWMETLDQRFHLRQLFSDLVLSCDHGTVKPGWKLIELAANHFGIPYESLVYIDDREENCHAALRLGLQPVLFRSAPVLRATLRGFGLALRADDRPDEWLGKVPQEET
jgi:HAD superfamily hydrolase (TIGR01509 family)